MEGLGEAQVIFETGFSSPSGSVEGRAGAELREDMKHRLGGI